MAVTHSIGAYRVSDQVLGAVREAARRTGADFRFLMAQAAEESGFRADAEARTSSATGLYQFIDSTWLAMVREHGAAHGLGALANHIDLDEAGRPRVSDAATRRHILDLRRDPRVNAVMAGELAQSNRAHLEWHVGGVIGPTELYLAHFLGADGATTFLSAMRRTPGRPAVDLFPPAAQANRAVFFDAATGAPRSLAEVYDRFARRLGEAGALADAAPARSVAAPGAIGRTAAYPVTATPVSLAGSASREALSLWAVLTLNALPPPGSGR